jgi:hypothetical protein
MLRVVVELVPHGDVKLAEVIATGWIANEYTWPDRQRANYHGKFMSLERVGDGESPPFYPQEKRERRERYAQTERFERNKFGVWPLVLRMLRNAFPEALESGKSVAAVDPVDGSSTS